MVAITIPHPLLAALLAVAIWQCIWKLKILGPISGSSHNLDKKGADMDSTTIIRMVSGILCVMILAVLVWRRKKTA